MELISVSDQWIEAFGKTLIHSIWAGLILVTVLKLVLATVSHQRSQMRYMLSISTLLLYTTSVVALFLILYQPGGTAINSARGSAGTEYPLWVQNISQAGGKAFHHSIWSTCCYLYASGIVFMILRLAYATYHLHHVKASGIPVQEPWNTHFNQLAKKLGIHRNVRLIVSDKITIPGLIGWMKPVVLVPTGMLTQLPMNQLETIMMHELYHLKRYDFVVNALQMILEGIFFYNPAIWLISRTIRVEREHCCDDLVVASCRTPLLYAKALFELSNKDHSFGNLVTAAGGPDASGLSHRILRILKLQAMKTDFRDKLLSLSIFAAGIAVILIINGFINGVSGMKPTGVDTGLITGPVVYTTVPEANPAPKPDQKTYIVQDTVPVPSEIENDEDLEVELTDEEIERIIDEARDAQQDALEDIDWEEIKESIEEAKREALEEIDWEEIKKEMEEVRIEVMEEIDWDAMKQEIEKSMNELEEIDWDQIRRDVEESMKEIDWEQMRKDLKESVKDIDIESFKIEIENSLNEVDWGEIKVELEQMRINLDSIRQDFVWSQDQ